jgi:glucose/arabinose dehydrogenase
VPEPRFPVGAAGTLILNPEPRTPSRRRPFPTWQLILAAALLLAAAARSSVRTQTVPNGFTQTVFAGGLSSATAMAFAPDGRLFVCQQGGRLRVIKNGLLLPDPFLTVTVNASGERGLLGVTFHPDFPNQPYVYVYYTATTPSLHNRISRFTANGDVAVAGSEGVLVDLDPLSSATNHNGGALHFGEDGYLYAAVGDNASSANAQALTTRHGKLLRYHGDGTIPEDNPFSTTAAGANRAIWALGLRNPFTFAFQPVTRRMFINDVGQNTWEEINDGLAGANYGWPRSEGPTADPRFQAPLFAYRHDLGCAIAGGAFYNPATVQFPASYLGRYFFADYCGGWIRMLNPADRSVSLFAAGIPAPVGLEVGPEGSLFVLSQAGAVHRIDYPAGIRPPVVTRHPASVTVPAGERVTFAVTADGSPPLRYQWQRNGTDIDGASSDSYALTAGPLDSEARFRCIVRNGAGSATSREAVLTVVSGGGPPAPDGLTAAAPARYRVELSWRDRSANETGFRLERKAGTGAFIEIRRLAPDTTAFTDGVAPNNTYAYRLRAYNSQGDSPYSGEAAVASLGTPARLRAIPISNAQIRLTWTDDCTGESGFRIERKTGAGSFAEVRTAGANATETIDGGLAPFTTYTYRLRAYAPRSFSDYSNEAAAATAVPPAPAGLTARRARNRKIRLTWQDESGDESGFRLERRDGATGFAEIRTLPASTVAYTDAGLRRRTTYTYRVRAFNTHGQSPYSNEAIATAR